MDKGRRERDYNQSRPRPMSFSREDSPHKVELQFQKLEKQKGNLDEIEKDLDQLLLVLHSERKSFETKRFAVS